jgi:hypothetical protein
MNEKRKYSRHSCLLKAKFVHYDCDPEEIESSKPQKGKGRVLDISQGGLFISTNIKVSINNPIQITFKVGNTKHTKSGIIIRTGLLKNNPSETIKKFSNLKIREKSYLAVQFDEPLGLIPIEEKLQA